jgi:hypothetical protein
MMQYQLNNDILMWQSYRFEGISYKYHSLSMDFNLRKTTLWLYHVRKLKIDRELIIPQIVVPDTLPSEGLLLAERVYKLKAFL